MTLTGFSPSWATAMILFLRLQQTRALGAPPGNQLLNDGEAIVAAEDGPDPLQGKLHLNPEVLNVFGDR